MILNDQKLKLESDLQMLYKQFQGLSTEYENACQTIKLLENHIATEINAFKSEAAQKTKERQALMDEQAKKIGELEEALKSRDDSLHDLESAYETTKSVADRRNR